MMPGVVMAASVGDPVVRSVDKSSEMAPHGFFRCAGDDTWVAIAVEDDTGWAALRQLLREAGRGTARRLGPLQARKAAEEELDRMVGSWTAELSPWQVTTACQGVGVAALIR